MSWSGRHCQRAGGKFARPFPKAALEKLNSNPRLRKLPEEEKRIIIDNILLAPYIDLRPTYVIAFLNFEQTHLLLKGNKVGEAKGVEQGIEQRNVEIAKAMLGKGYDLATIQELTGLSPEEIKSL